MTASQGVAGWPRPAMLFRLQASGCAAVAVSGQTGRLTPPEAARARPGSDEQTPGHFLERRERVAVRAAGSEDAVPAGVLAQMLPESPEDDVAVVAVRLDS